MANLPVFIPCPSCGQEAISFEPYCGQCGEAMPQTEEVKEIIKLFAQDSLYSTECGTEAHQFQKSQGLYKFCPKCGNKN